MYLFEAYTTIQGKLQQYEEKGWITPAPEAARSRFLAFAETDLIPLTRRLATILNQAGVPAQAIDQLEEETPWFGLVLDETRAVGVFLQTLDPASMHVTIRFSWDPTVEEQHVLLYRKCTRVSFASALERCIERLLIRPPL